MSQSVSIVIPSFQQARFLRAAVESVLAQDYPGLEVLVLDGGSTDGSVEILEGFGNRIWFRSCPDGGQVSAINEGLRRSSGDIVAWLNSDDVYYPGAVRTAVEALKRRPDAGLVYGEGDLMDENGEVLRRFPETVPFDLWRLANVADYILQPTVFMRRRTLFSAGLLDERLHWGFDWDLWLRLAARQPFGHVPEVLAASRVHDGTKTATGGWRRLRELHRILRAHRVSRMLPAGCAHGITTAVRAIRPSHDPVSPETLGAAMPWGTRWAARRMATRTERWLRRWIQNAQGVWCDGLVGRVGHLWWPAERGGAFVVRGHNLDLPGQVVELSIGRRRVRSARLEAHQAFALEMSVPPDRQPVKARLRCARVGDVAALDANLGPRRAGCALDGCALYSSSPC